MLNLLERVAVYQLGLGIGYFKLPNVVDWVDLTILQFDSSEIPYQLYEVSLSSNKKIADVISLLSEITRGNHIETASNVVFGLLYKSFEKKEIEINQVVTLMNRLALQQNIEDDIFSKISGLDTDYEMAVDGYGDMQSVIKKIQEFLGRYEMYGELI
ncbi:hypothetical protein [Neobacillus drentensis]|uniref:hypothetical protein n=1 Tax=Neobacillus drentensis TaxID=220684 RepID=UPI0028573E23|nr:hypothetical protein [Neobacillus drentensis]MDR7235967.1 hypothetical protein [Neobacillus drentensis]